MCWYRNQNFLVQIISKDLSDNSEKKRQYRAICIRSNVLCRRFCKCSQNVKVYLFRSYCVSMYWSMKQLNSLRVCYNNSLILLLRRPRSCSASGMFVEVGISSFYEFLRKSIYSFKCRIFESQNVIVKCIVKYLLEESSLNKKME